MSIFKSSEMSAKRKSIGKEKEESGEQKKTKLEIRQEQLEKANKWAEANLGKAAQTPVKIVVNKTKDTKTPDKRLSTVSQRGVATMQEQSKSRRFSGLLPVAAAASTSRRQSSAGPISEDNQEDHFDEEDEGEEGEYVSKTEKMNASDRGGDTPYSPFPVQSPSVSSVPHSNSHTPFRPDNSSMSYLPLNEETLNRLPVFKFGGGGGLRGTATAAATACPCRD